jgi:hypothetical protein
MSIFERLWNAIHPGNLNQGLRGERLWRMKDRLGVRLAPKRQAGLTVIGIARCLAKWASRPEIYFPAKL